MQSAMNRIFEVAQKKESLASAFRKLTARNLSIIPVVEDQRLVGHCDSAEPDALHGAAGREPQAAQGSAEPVEEIDDF